MEKYLVTLLELNQRVIVPELGAFILRQNEPKDLVFNDLLAFDDGMLIDHIMQVDKLSKSEAQNRIKQFVDTIKNSLEAGDNYKLGQLGILKMDESSKIEFSSSGTVSVSEEFAAEETPTETTIEKVEEETSQASDPEEEEEPETSEPSEVPGEEEKEEPDTDEPSGVPEEEEKEEPEAAEPSEDPGVEESEPAEVVIEEKLDAVEETEEDEQGEVAPEESVEEMDESDEKTGPEEIIEEVSSDEKEGFVLEDGDSDVDIDATQEDTPLKADSEEPPFQIEDEEEPEEEPEETDVAEDTQEYKVVTSKPESSPFSVYTQSTKSKKKVWPWIVGAAALVMLLLVAGWFIFPEKVDRLLGKHGTESMEEEPAIIEEVEAISEDTETPVDEPEIQTEDQSQEADIEETLPPVQPTEKMYYVVAGCFANLTNAENYVSKLRDQGYEASIFGMYKDLHAVCFNSHPTRQGAVEELYRVKDSFDQKAWILYY
ncbi:hypothetical protein ACFLTA_03355 [Bacteroidota bacterium]